LKTVRALTASISLGGCVALLLVAPPAGEAGRPRSCAPSHVRVLAADATAAVYARRGAAVTPGGRRRPGTVYGCARGGARAYRLGPAPTGDAGFAAGVAHVTLAGSKAAYELHCEVFGDPLRVCVALGAPQSPSSHLVMVRDLRSGRLVHRVAVSAPSAGEGVQVGVAARSIAVKADGSVAWIADTTRSPRYEVHEADRSGTRVVALGSDIDPASLRVRGSAIHWRQGTMPFSAPLS
jgi:hypothetical protein